MPHYISMSLLVTNSFIDRLLNRVDSCKMNKKRHILLYFIVYSYYLYLFASLNWHGTQKRRFRSDDVPLHVGCDFQVPCSFAGESKAKAMSCISRKKSKWGAQFRH